MNAGRTRASVPAPPKHSYSVVVSHWRTRKRYAYEVETIGAASAIAAARRMAGDEIGRVGDRFGLVAIHERTEDV